MAEFTTSIFSTYSGWIISSPVTSAITACGIYKNIFGGYDKFGQTTQIYKTFSTDYPHYSAVVSFNFLRADTWDAADYVNIYFPVYGTKGDTLTISDFTPTTNICGGSWADQVKALSYTVTTHTAPTFGLKFIGNFDSAETDESWGIRDLRITLKMCDTTCDTCSGAASNNCLSCLTNALLTSGTCTCREYYYHKPYGSPPTPYKGSASGYCARCDISCNTCDGGTSIDCLTCDSPDSFSGGICSPPSSKNFLN